MRYLLAILAVGAVLPASASARQPLPYPLSATVSQGSRHVLAGGKYGLCLEGTTPCGSEIAPSFHIHTPGSITVKLSEPARVSVSSGTITRVGSTEVRVTFHRHICREPRRGPPEPELLTITAELEGRRYPFLIDPLSVRCRESKR